MKELAAYENVDLRLFYGSDRPVPAPLVKDLTAIPSAQNVVTLVPVLNPHHELCEYRWPVHMICRGYASLKRVKQGRYTLLVYRDPETLKVRFFELNPLTADLLKKIQPGRLSIGALIENLAERHRPMDVPSFVTEAMGTLQLLRDKGILLGYRKK